MGADLTAPLMPMSHTHADSRVRLMKWHETSSGDGRTAIGDEFVKGIIKEASEKGCEGGARRAEPPSPLRSIAGYGPSAPLTRNPLCRAARCAGQGGPPAMVPPFPPCGSEMAFQQRRAATELENSAMELRLVETLRIAAGAIVIAMVTWLLLALPGFVSNQDSHVNVAVSGGTPR
jgi:hypothetical protein